MDNKGIMERIPTTVLVLGVPFVAFAVGALGLSQSDAMIIVPTALLIAVVVYAVALVQDLVGKGRN